MAFIPCPGVVQVTLRSVIHNSIPMYNVFNFLRPDPFGQAEADDFALHVSASLANINPQMHESTTYLDVLCTGLDDDSDAQFESSEGFPIPGTAHVVPMPSQTALVVSWKTVLRGRNWRGRTYLGGFDGQVNVGTGPTASCLTHVNDFAANMRDNSHGQYLVVLSKFDGMATNPTTGKRRGVPRAEGIYSLVTGHHVGNAWDNMRSRRSLDSA